MQNGNTCHISLTVEIKFDVARTKMVDVECTHMFAGNSLVFYSQFTITVRNMICTV